MKNTPKHNNEYWFMIEKWKETTGNSDIDMEAVAEFAHRKYGWKLPPPVSALARLAKQFSRAARQKTNHDGETGRPYRVYHAFPKDGDPQGRMIWFDIDEDHATRDRMWKSAVMRREQMVGDAVQLTLDLDHWNRKHASEEPIVLPNDLQPDVDWRLNGPEESAA